jgi:hypothetical protein
MYHDEKDAVFDYTCDNNLTTVSEIRLVERYQPRRFLQVMREKWPKRPGWVTAFELANGDSSEMKRTSVKEKSS